VKLPLKRKKTVAGHARRRNTRQICWEGKCPYDEREERLDMTSNQGGKL